MQYRQDRDHGGRLDEAASNFAVHLGSCKTRLKGDHMRQSMPVKLAMSAQDALKPVGRYRSENVGNDLFMLFLLPRGPQLKVYGQVNSRHSSARYLSPNAVTGGRPWLSLPRGRPDVRWKHG